MKGTQALLKLASVLTLICVATNNAAAQFPAGPPEGFEATIGGALATMFGPEIALVEAFDVDDNGRLNLEERNAARASLGPSQPGLSDLLLMQNRFVGNSPGATIRPEDVEIFGDESLYDESTLRTVFLTFESDDWEAELAAFKNTDVEVAANVLVDGQTYSDVGVHFRGASSFMMIQDGSKRSLNLSFDFVDSDQNLLGYRTVNLLNANSDPTFLRGVLYSHIAREFLPAPRINFVRVVINGENWGIYLNAQQFNTDFTRDWFGTRSGARWKTPGSPFGRAGMEYLGDDIDAYRDLYDIRSRDRERSWEALIGMFRILNETPPEQLQAQLEPVLDLDSVLRFLALDVALVNSDGYWVRASDYNIYLDEKNRFHVIPHDMNEAMLDEGGGPGGEGQEMPPEVLNALSAALPGLLPEGSFPENLAEAFGGGGPDLDPLIGLNDRSKPLRSKLLAVPELREIYLGYVREIADTWLDWERIEPLLADYRELIRSDVERDTRKLYATAEFDTGFDGESQSLKSFVDARREYLLEALD